MKKIYLAGFAALLLTGTAQAATDPMALVGPVSDYKIYVQSQVDEVTRPLQQAPERSRPPEPSLPPAISDRSKLVALGGVVVLGGTLAWALATPKPSAPPAPLVSVAARPAAPPPVLAPTIAPTTDGINAAVK